MLRVGLAQVNATVGDLAGNSEIIVEWTRRAAARGARVVVFPEMALTGYPVEDLALRASFVEASIAAVRDVAERLNVEGLGGVAVVVGYLDRRAGLAPRTGLPAGAPLDAAAVLHGGRVVITSAKHDLPNYGVFDEFRYFVPGNTLPVFRVPVAGAGGAGEAGEAVDVAGAICEDLWQDGGPVAVCRHAGAALLVVPNASPYERGKDDVRLDLVQRRAREAGAALAYCNLVGGQDELVFDGDSILVSASGEVLARGPQFEEALIIADLELPSAEAGPGPDTVADERDIRPAAGGSLPRLSGAGEAVDAGDGTAIVIERVALPGVPLPAGDISEMSGEGGRGRGRRGRRADLAAAGRPGRGVRRAGARHGGLRAEERVRFRAARAVRRDRLRARRHDRGRRGRAGERQRDPHAEQVVVRPLGERRRGPRGAAGDQRAHHRHPVDRGRLQGRARKLPRLRAARREPAVQGARGHQHGGVQQRGPPRAPHRKQERDRHRVLHPVRGLGRRLRPDQGRAQDPRLGPGAVAERGGRAAGGG